MPIQTSTYVLIAGSRAATREMLDYARRAVLRAFQLGWTVLVGDNPQGVDRAVVLECRRLQTNVIVAGIAPFPRNFGTAHGSYVQVPRDLYRSAGGDLLGGYGACVAQWGTLNEGFKTSYGHQPEPPAHPVQTDGWHLAKSVCSSLPAEAHSPIN